MDTLTLGEKYRDTITGFVGVCTGICAYLYGCRQALLTPELDSDGKIVKGIWIDEQRLVLADIGAELESVAVSGGPQDHPSGPEHP